MAGDSPHSSGREDPEYLPDEKDHDYNDHEDESHHGDSSSNEDTRFNLIRSLTRDPNTELSRIASVFSHADEHSTATDSLARIDTLAGLQLGDAVLNPSSPQFDFYKWARMLMKLMEEDGLKRRRTGITFRNLSVYGSGPALQLQSTVSTPIMALFRFQETFGVGRKTQKRILNNFHGALREGEMLVVLGRPGSGCSTFLKTICGETHGLELEREASVQYNGIPQTTFKKEFRGEAVYSAEDEKHFPHLTVGQTLEFAAACRTPSARVMGMARKEFSHHIARVVMAIFGLSHTANTKVGDDYVRGVSGGERKRVSIAELGLSGAPVICWDNSTRGLDSATALEFTRALRVASDVMGATQAVAIYQASQAIYDLFDKAVVLYDGRQIYYGPANSAKKYFEDMGWYCPPRQTTGDFLTSITNPMERRVRDGFESKVPRTAHEFETYWRNSLQFKDVLAEIEQCEHEHPVGGPALGELREAHNQAQAKHVRPKSPYTITIPMQVKLCTTRAYQRLWNDKASTISRVMAQLIMSLIIGSLYFNTPQVTSSFFSKGSVLFFAILLNALLSISEINTKDSQRPIVSKHVSYALYYSCVEAFAGIVSDIPIKLITSTVFNIIIYFLGDLRRQADHLFIFFLFTFITMLTMSAIFRTLAAATKTISQALAFAGVMVLAIVIYTGFTIQRSYMHPWMEWISWINPVAYAFEAILVNEVHSQRYACAQIVPPYGEESQYGYKYSHIWRNLGFIFAFQVFFYVLYLTATQLNTASASTAEFLVFRRGNVPKYMLKQNDEENDKAAPPAAAAAAAAGANSKNEEDKTNVLPPQTDVFTWRNVTYDITIKGEDRRILDHVSGWVRPGTLTALMGVSGAGKTTLLDVLAQRISFGVVTGDMFVNGKPLDLSFQRKTGYCQQQDLHLETSTVREALRFSAMLRQPQSVSKQEKYEFVEDVIKMLNMEDFAEAVVGSPGEGLNVEQRKLLTIGVELAAKPQLLLFLDEPTSGLDSQSAWAIVTFLRKLADHGQAVLSTIHQPSAVLFQEFDRLLLLAKGGKTVYFGEIGKNSETMLNYFAAHGAERCRPDENPAEYMLNVVGAGPSGKSTQDWAAVWNNSQEAKQVQDELDRIHAEKAEKHDPTADQQAVTQEFAMPMTSQIYYVTFRVFQQYWRTPTYIWGKFLLGFMSAVFIGFSFYKQNSSSSGLQNTLFAIFMLTTIFTSLVQQIMPRFVTQRSLFEVRERPSRTYGWKAFLLANIIVEIPYQILLGIVVWASLYFPVFGKNQTSEQQGTFLIYSVQFMIFASTFAHMVIAGLPDAETAGHIATTLFSLSLTFNGVMQPPRALPGFWIFMWRVSPLTYTVGGLAATGLHNRIVNCAENEFAIFNPPSGATCGQYLAEFFAAGAQGQLEDPNATQGCRYCSLRNADQFLARSEVFWSQRWRNFGLGWAYIGFNVFAAVALYYMLRVRTSTGKTRKRASLVKHYVRWVGSWVRALFTTRIEKTPEEKIHVNDRIL
ncbi:hypothetical protein PABG_05655 [Paracoccidioides brasiliensis Pb03]|nr:hypothetical protein PABG_05655 [Paracoccidioides brasiliensis Pb03]